MHEIERRAEAAKYLLSRDLRERYRISDMSLWRWLRDDKLAFPKPIAINGRRYWLIAEIEQWERARAARAPSP